MITILCIASRTQHLPQVFACLEDLERPDDTELLIVLDGYDNTLQSTVDRQLDHLSYKSIRVVTFDSDGAEQTIDQRRYRISALHNFAKHYIKDTCDYVMSIEDDTTFEPDALNDLLTAFKDPLCAFVEGVELGRHATAYIGGWLADDINNPYKITSLDYNSYDRFDYLANIDAGGLYCCLIRADLYKSHQFEPYDKVGTNGLSCDVNMGLSFRRLGYTNYIDWSVQCRHLTDDGYISLENTEPVQISFTKTNNKWEVGYETI